MNCLSKDGLRIEELKNLIVKMVREKRNVSFVDIEKIFESKDIDYLGDYAIATSKNEHIFVWGGWRADFVDLISQVCKENLIEMEPCSPLVYAVDGKMLSMPLVKEAFFYKTDHWLPVVLINPGTSKYL
ncbi:pathogenicity island protein [Clostridium botulinum]|uniref:Pathogenicity island protein n=1 Tax=Clostridium botulinum TaxID=1491 RepID=A0A6M0SLN6_CLOBO|nr:pathogenicity island protein [Clostridium botulinum]